MANETLWQAIDVLVAGLAKQLWSTSDKVHAAVKRAATCELEADRLRETPGGAHRLAARHKQGMADGIVAALVYLDADRQVVNQCIEMYKIVLKAEQQEKKSEQENQASTGS